MTATTGDRGALLQRRASPLECLRPARWELLGLVSLLVYYVFSVELFGEEGHSTTNVVGPVWLTVVLALGIHRMVRMNPISMWTALFWFRLSSGLYFGLGSLVPFFGSLESRLYIERFFLYSDSDLARLNMLVAASMLVVLGIAAVLPTKSHACASRREEDQGGRGILYFGMAFYVVGAISKYFISLPYQLGLVPETIAGATSILGACAFVGMYLLSVWGFERARYMLPFLIALLAFDFAIGLLVFAKSDPMLLLLMFVLGMFRRGVTLVRLAIAVPLVVAAYAAISPVVTHGRFELLRRYGAGNAAATLPDRAAIVSDYYTGGAQASYRDQDLIDYSWIRLSYVSPAIFAMHMYDVGRPSPSLDHIFAIFIPRFLWPEKPLITQIAFDFNMLATNNPNSASAPGLFADAYWNYGWGGVGLLIVPVGVILGYISILAINLLRRGRWLYFPLIFIGMRMGFRSDGFIVADIFGPAVLLIVGYVVLNLVEHALVAWFRHPLPA